VGIPLDPVNKFDEELDRFDAIAEELEGETLVLDDDSSEASGDF
jgi:exonuclease VII small subunit